MKKKFICTVCGYVYEGAEPPEKCPVCGAPASKFKELDETEELSFVTEHEIGVAKGTDAEMIADLTAHFNGECGEVGMYLAMSRQADREGYPEIAEAFKRYAFEEAEHAAKFAELLGECVWDTKTNLEKRMAAEAGANAAKSAVILEGNYSYTVDTEGITALINAIETAAEAQRTAANEAAYQATLAEIQRLTDKLDNMKALIATTYPDVNVDEAIAAAAAAIEAAKNGAADALAAVKDEGKYSYTVDAAAIEALIDAIRTAAAEAQAALDKENARVEANQAAYEEAIAQIDALQAALDAMKANVEENYPDADVTAEIEAAQAAIDNARSEAEDALEAVAEEGTFAYSPDTDSVDALIAAIETAAKAAGIVNIEADAAKGILYYDINGRRVINPERGMVVIRLTPDGQVTKIIL